MKLKYKIFVIIMYLLSHIVLPASVILNFSGELCIVGLKRGS